VAIPEQADLSLEGLSLGGKGEAPAQSAIAMQKDEAWRLIK